MARINPVPESERAICRRFREFRLDLNLTAVAFAKRLGIDSNRLSTYEHGRVPLPFGIAHKAEKVFFLNLRWLAEGGAIQDAIMCGQLRMGDSIYTAIEPRALFSEVWLKHLKAPYDQYESFRKQWESSDSFGGGLLENLFSKPWSSSLKPAEVVDVIRLKLQQHTENLPPMLYPQWIGSVLKHAREFIDEHQSDIDAWNQTAPTDTGGKNVVEKGLQFTSEYGTNGLDMDVMRKLLNRVRKLTAARGAKAALAEQLKVPQSRVSEWLSGKCMPDGFNALRLVKWADEAEHQQQSPESVAAGSGPAAQFERTVHELKSKSSRGKH